jgi:O-acetylserine/cysteine efflux transporter
VLASLPLLWFVPRPKVALSTVALYGGLIGVGQFGLMFFAMNGHISPGLASVLIQMQALFTVVLAMLMGGERPRAGNVAALVVSLAGIGLIAFNTHGDADALGIALVLTAALAWAGCNLVAKRAGSINMLALMVWSSLFAVPPLLAVTLLAEGPDAAFAAIRTAGIGDWSTVVWQAAGNTLFGYGAWNWLLSRHSATQVAPLGLLVPVFGLSGAAWFLGEGLPGWKLAAAALVIAGLVINLRVRAKAAA